MVLKLCKIYFLIFQGPRAEKPENENVSSVCIDESRPAVHTAAPSVFLFTTELIKRVFELHVCLLSPSNPQRSCRSTWTEQDAARTPGSLQVPQIPSGLEGLGPPGGAEGHGGRLGVSVMKNTLSSKAV